MMWKLCLAAPTLAQIARMVLCGTTRCRFITPLKKTAAAVDTALVSLFAGSNLRRESDEGRAATFPRRASILSLLHLRVRSGRRRRSDARRLSLGELM